MATITKLETTYLLIYSFTFASGQPYEATVQVIAPVEPTKRDLILQWYADNEEYQLRLLQGETLLTPPPPYPIL